MERDNKARCGEFQFHGEAIPCDPSGCRVVIVEYVWRNRAIEGEVEIRRREILVITHRDLDRR